MALIECPKCGKMFSVHAQACPQCGLSKGEVLAFIEKREEEIRLAAQRKAAELERQRREEQERLRKEREEKETEEARIRSEKRAEWWKKNRKKVWITIAIFVSIISVIIAVPKIQNAIAERELNQMVEAYLFYGDSCVNVFAFDEANSAYQQAIWLQEMQLKDDSETRDRIAKLYKAKAKADADYNVALERLKILLEADDNEFNRYSNECLDKMIAIYPNRTETIYYKNLRGDEN